MSCKTILFSLVCAKIILHEYFLDENLLDEKKRITAVKSILYLECIHVSSHFHTRNRKMVALPGSEAGLAGYETIHYWLTLVIIPGSSACRRGWE